MIERESTTRVFGQVNSANDLKRLVDELFSLEEIDGVKGSIPIKLTFRPNNGIDILSITIVKRVTK